jgi:hypothetical protein
MRQFRAARKRLLKQDQCPIRLQHVSPRANVVLRRIGLGELIALINRAILRESAARAKSAMRHSIFDRHIERSAIRACLAAGDDFQGQVGCRRHGRERTTPAANVECQRAAGA